MNVKLLKQILWVVNSLLVAAILLVAVRFFALSGGRQAVARDVEKILGRENVPKASPPLKSSQVLPADTFMNAWKLPLSGDPPIEAKAPAPGEAPKLVSPLAKDYKLLWTKVDTGDPLACQAHLERIAKKDVISVSVGGIVESGWKLVRVRNDEADFEQTRTGEQLTMKVERMPTGPLGAASPGGPGPAPLGTTIGGGETGSQPREGPSREMVESRPGSGIFDVPPESREWWAEYGESVLEKDVTVQPVTDPDTGKAAGLMLKEITTGSYPARCGFRPGDIVRSVNGVPVHSRQEAVAYARGPGKDAAKYVVEVERGGRVITLTFNVKR
ncbi:MAG: PDZ domain-containing protein [Planctomycetes bacterium]|nr:PDZ domain-containing protein [Planctomycetota bacterium]